MSAKRPSVKLIVINEREVLIATSSRSGSKKFPGGGIESGEGIVEAAERELLEETHLVAVAMQYLGKIEGTFSAQNQNMSHGLKPGDATEEHYFLVSRYSGEPHADDDACQLEWVSIDQVKGLLTYDTQKQGFDLLK